MRESEISTNELRLNFDRVLKAVKQGRSLALTYRNKPLARIVPLKDEQVLSEDPVFNRYLFLSIVCVSSSFHHEFLSLS